MNGSYAGAADGLTGGGVFVAWSVGTIAAAAVIAFIIGLFLKMHVRSRRQIWPSLASVAYSHGVSLVTALKSGRQDQAAFESDATAYGQQLLHLQEESPGEDARWVAARVAAAVDEVRLAVSEHPGTEEVRTSVDDLEQALRGLRDAAGQEG